MLKKIANYIKLIRPHHYLKNFFIFAPLIFALRFTEVNLLTKTILASIIFSIIMGVVYIINDYRDIEEDKLHPKKKFRPLASGEVTKKEAIILGIFLLAVGIISSYLLNIWMLGLCLFYLVINLAYSFKLKHIAIVDVFIVATGFIIRVFIGSVVTGIMLTNWIVIIVFLLALFLSFAKRRDDVLIFNKTGKKMRKSIDGYNETFVNAALIVSLTAILVSYIIYTTIPESIEKFNSHNLYMTSFFVIFGILRYLQITFVEEVSDSPVNILLKDRLIQLSVLGWILTFAALIYF